MVCRHVVIELTAVLGEHLDEIKDVQVGPVSQLEGRVGGVTGVAIVGLLKEGREGGYTGCETTRPAFGVTKLLEDDVVVFLVGVGGRWLTCMGRNRCTVVRSTRSRNRYGDTRLRRSRQSFPLPPSA